MIEFRPARFDDAETLFKWRNDPETRANSVNTDEIPWPDHAAWMERSLADQRRRIYIAEKNGSPVGTVRVDYGLEIELSWTVAPEHRGNGIGKLLVQNAPLPEEPIIARIKPGNIASQKIAAAAGFVLVTKGRLDPNLQLWRRTVG